MLCIWLGGCASWRPVDDRDLPTLRLLTERQFPDPTTKPCPTMREVSLVRGPVPAAARVIVRLKLTAVDRPASLATYESVLRTWSAKHCIGQVSVLKAEAADEGRAIIAVTADAWVRMEAGPAREEKSSRREGAEEAEERFWQ